MDVTENTSKNSLNVNFTKQCIQVIVVYMYIIFFANILNFVEDSTAYKFNKRIHQHFYF